MLAEILFRRIQMKKQLDKRMEIGNMYVRAPAHLSANQVLFASVHTTVVLKAICQINGYSSLLVCLLQNIFMVVQRYLCHLLHQFWLSCATSPSEVEGPIPFGMGQGVLQLLLHKTAFSATQVGSNDGDRSYCHLSCTECLV